MPRLKMNMKQNSLTSKRTHSTVKSLLAASMLLTFAGCTTHQPSLGPTSLRNKITVAETVERLELYTQAGGLNLSARDEDAVSAFIYQYANAGEGPLYINVPSNAAGGLGVQQAQNAIGTRLTSLGIPASAIQTGQYPAMPNVPAPLVVSYRRLAVQPIDCQQGASLTHTANNQPYLNFGCFQSANLAAMVADPRQLLAPVDAGSQPAWRGTRIINKMQEGEPTSTPRPDGQEISATAN
jgi:pilus assembly protein CpaD